MPLDISNLDNVEGKADVTVRASREQADENTSLFILVKFPGGKMAAGTRVECKAAKEGEMIEEAVMLSPEAARDLITDLWFAGHRPEGVEFDHSGELRATLKHLADTKAMMMAFWNKLNGQTVAMGQPLNLQKPFPTGAQVKNPSPPKANKNGGKKK